MEEEFIIQETATETVIYKVKAKSEEAARQMILKDEGEVVIKERYQSQDIKVIKTEK